MGTGLQYEAVVEVAGPHSHFTSKHIAVCNHDSELSQFTFGAIGKAIDIICGAFISLS